MAKLSYNKSDSILKVLRVVNRIPLITWLTETLYKAKTIPDKVNCAGVTFEHPVGLSSGIDRTGEFCNIAASYGVSFVEIGPLYDVRAAIANLRTNPPVIPVLANLSGKDDLRSFSLIYDFVDAVVLNIPVLGFEAGPIDRILQMRQYNDQYRPVLFRIVPEISAEKLDKVIDYALGSGIDGLMVPSSMLEKVVPMARGHMEIICYGMFENASDVEAALSSGAAAVAITNRPGTYGPSFIKRLLKGLVKK